MRQSKKRADDKAQEEAPDLFADMFDGDLDPEAKTEFYAHDQNWTNRMILGDSLQVMASLAEREGLRGKVRASILTRLMGSSSDQTGRCQLKIRMSKITLKVLAESQKW